MLDVNEMVCRLEGGRGGGGGGGEKGGRSGMMHPLKI